MSLVEPEELPETEEHQHGPVATCADCAKPILCCGNYNRYRGLELCHPCLGVRLRENGRRIFGTEEPKP